MSDGFLVANESAPLVQQAIDYSRRANPFGPTSGNSPSAFNFVPQRGYLMQSISRGETGLCQLVTRNGAYECWKIDLAGVIYLNHPDGDSYFQLVFSSEGEDIFETERIPVEGLTAGELLRYITEASDGMFGMTDMVGALGHPTQSQIMVNNSDLYPALPSTYKQGDLIDSLIGSWIFGFSQSKIPANFDINLKFTVSDEDPIQLNGPAVMTLHQITDCPTHDIRLVADVMDIAQPTPLRGGTKVVLLPFGDLGCLGIIAANPREYLFRLDFENGGSPI